VCILKCVRTINRQVDIHDDTDRTFGHVFTLHVLPDGTVQLYQSFIQQFSLPVHLARTPPFTQPRLNEFLDNLALLEKRIPMGQVRVFGEAERQAYHRNFQVLLQKKTAGNITVRSFVACVMPPWNGTHANGLEATHAATEAKFVLPELRRQVARVLRLRPDIDFNGNCLAGWARVPRRRGPGSAP
jgi:hypothetical protein